MDGDEKIERLRPALADRYRIEEEIGRGGMAVVFSARDLRHDRQVAIKVMRNDLGLAAASDRFLREIRTAALSPARPSARRSDAGTSASS